MPSTYTLISSNVLSSSAASVTFSAIPSTYTDLVLRCSIRDSGSSGTSQQQVRVRINGSSSANYSRRNLTGVGSTAASGNGTSNTSIAGFYAPDAGATSNTFNSFEVYIPNYATVQQRQVSVFNAFENNSSTVNEINATAALYTNTTTITSLYIDTVSGLVSGSSFYLYGIKSS